MKSITPIRQPGGGNKSADRFFKKKQQIKEKVPTKAEWQAPKPKVSPCGFKVDKGTQALKS